MATLRADSQAAADAAAAAAAAYVPPAAPAAPAAWVNPYTAIIAGTQAVVTSGQQLVADMGGKPVPITPVTTTITSPGGSSTVIKNNTNATNQAIIDAYIAKNPAPPGTHYSQTLGPDGKPILYKNLSSGGGGGGGGGGTGGGNGANPVTTNTTLTAAENDAYALLEQTFTQYGLDSLLPVIQGYMKNNIGPNQAALMIRQEQAYKTRFAGNVLRVSNGLNAMSEAEYLAVENSYNETLNAYGLQNYFGTTRDQKIAGMASIIAGDVSATEFQGRVKLAEDQVINSDPAIKNQLQAFYGINSSDLMKYYLDPTQNLSALTQKTLSAEIGAAAVNQGLTTSVSAAESLMKQGVTQGQAQAGYATIGQEMPIAGKLSSVYGNQGVNVTQADLEANQFNTAGAASAARKRQQMIDLEKGSFSGRSGIVGSSSQAGYSGSLGKSIQGKF